MGLLNVYLIGTAISFVIVGSIISYDSGLLKDFILASLLWIFPLVIINETLIRLSDNKLDRVVKHSKLKAIEKGLVEGDDGVLIEYLDLIWRKNTYKFELTNTNPNTLRLVFYLKVLFTPSRKLKERSDIYYEARLLERLK